MHQSLRRAVRHTGPASRVHAGLVCFPAWEASPHCVAALKVEKKRPKKWAQRPFCSLSSFLLSSSCGLLSNQPGPLDTQPRSMDPDHMANRAPNRLCHLSTTESKTNRRGATLLSRRDPGSERGGVPPAPPLAVCLAPLLALPSALHSLSRPVAVSLPPPGRVKDSPRENFLTLLFAFPRLSGKFSKIFGGEKKMRTIC